MLRLWDSDLRFSVNPLINAIFPSGDRLCSLCLNCNGTAWFRIDDRQSMQRPYVWQL
jgi:hypothetical protein